MAPRCPCAGSSAAAEVTRVQLVMAGRVAGTSEGRIRIQMTPDNRRVLRNR